MVNGIGGNYDGYGYYNKHDVEKTEGANPANGTDRPSNVSGSEDYGISLAFIEPDSDEIYEDFDFLGTTISRRAIDSAIEFLSGLENAPGVFQKVINSEWDSCDFVSLAIGDPSAHNDLIALHNALNQIYIEAIDNPEKFDEETLDEIQKYQDYIKNSISGISHNKAQYFEVVDRNALKKPVSSAETYSLSVLDKNGNVNQTLKCDRATLDNAVQTLMQAVDDANCKYVLNDALGSGDLLSYAHQNRNNMNDRLTNLYNALSYAYLHPEAFSDEQLDEIEKFQNILETISTNPNVTEDVLDSRDEVTPPVTEPPVEEPEPETPPTPETSTAPETSQTPTPGVSQTPGPGVAPSTPSTPPTPSTPGSSETPAPGVSETPIEPETSTTPEVTQAPPTPPTPEASQTPAPGVSETPIKPETSTAPDVTQAPPTPPTPEASQTPAPGASETPAPGVSETPIKPETSTAPDVAEPEISQTLVYEARTGVETIDGKTYDQNGKLMVEVQEINGDKITIRYDKNEKMRSKTVETTTDKGVEKITRYNSKDKISSETWIFPNSDGTKVEVTKNATGSFSIINYDENGKQASIQLYPSEDYTDEMFKSMLDNQLEKMLKG